MYIETSHIAILILRYDGHILILKRIDISSIKGLHSAEKNSTPGDFQRPSQT